jgi:nickel-dependent lactate racemase
LTDEQIEAIVAESLASIPLDGRRVLVIIPDHTRTMPLPLFFRLLAQRLAGRVKALNFLIALGTHPPMSEAAILHMLGLTPEIKAAEYRDIGLVNHAWDDPAALVSLGEISADEIAALSGGLMRQALTVRLNRLILEHDHLLVCGPVFPHEVVGFSGGNKYFFPGIAGSDIIALTHWLGALLTSHAIIGTKDTPVRQVIDRAAAMIPRPRHAFCSVVSHEGVDGLFFGTPEEAYSAAADLSAQRHIVRVERPYQSVLSVLPEMYDEIWVGAKGMYKLEPVVADGGEVIVYAPHIAEFSVTHGALIRQVGYHVRDYFLKQWDRFGRLPLSVLAHSTHLRGSGTYEAGQERPRIRVTLATGISEDLCRQVNLGYRDPATIDPAEWAGREAEGILLVPRAGEDLYRLKPKS